eukprot:TRINITY_DN808_c0_g2_i1.p1 TRINITY_DN808_c0_g2~~TRINITY_DN808_c0_g2_i1.p1  ORF type:complete len:291 (+),score=55.98 TRINITY_DN808_c0_g2_i1:71-874(+)
MGLLHETDNKQMICPPSIVTWLLTLLSTCSVLCTCTTIPERMEAVVLLWGRYYTTIRRPGLYWFNPCGIEMRKVSVNIQAHDLKTVKVTDSNGNPCILSAIITFRVVNSVRAILDVEDYESFVIAQGLATLKRVASNYPYETHDPGAPSLKSEAAHIGLEAVAMLQEKVDVAGVEILSFALTDLSYAPEIAQAMLVRQQAQATLDARRIIVDGAVSLASDAVRMLEERGERISPAQRVKIVGNLLTVICGDTRASPTVQLQSWEPTD